MTGASTAKTRAVTQVLRKLGFGRGVTDETLAECFPDAVAAFERVVADAAYVRAEWATAARLTRCL